MTRGISLLRMLAQSRAAAALEFALITPVLILMGLGAVELSAAIRAQMQVDQIAHTVANLISNEPAGTSITALQLQDYLLAANRMFNYSNLGTLTISAASVNYTNMDSQGLTLPSVNNSASPSVAVGWDAGTAGVGYTKFPASGGGSALGELVSGLSLSDTVNNDSGIVVVASATFKVPFLPSFYGKLPSQLGFSTLALARPRFELQIPQGF